MYNRIYVRLLHAPTVSLGQGTDADCVLRVTECQQRWDELVRPDPLPFLYTILLMLDIWEYIPSRF